MDVFHNQTTSGLRKKLINQFQTCLGKELAKLNIGPNCSRGTSTFVYTYYLIGRAREKKTKNKHDKNVSANLYCNKYLSRLSRFFSEKILKERGSF